MTCSRLAALLAVAAIVFTTPSHAQPRPSVQLSDITLARPAVREGASVVRVAGSKTRVDNKYDVPKAPRKTEEPSKFSGGQSRRSPSAATDGAGCTSCRSACTRRWRTNCGNTSTCKKSYSGCMRTCWEEYCKP